MIEFEVITKEEGEKDRGDTTIKMQLWLEKREDGNIALMAKTEDKRRTIFILGQNGKGYLIGNVELPGLQTIDEGGFLKVKEAWTFGYDD